MQQILETPVILPIIEQHAEEAAFLWILRNGAIRDPHYNLKDLTDLDNRVEAHLNGLRIAGKPAWEICEKALELEEAGEAFAATVLALESEDGSRLDTAISSCKQLQETLGGLVSAFGWLPFTKIEHWLQSMGNASTGIYRYISMSAHAIHRVNPGANYLHKAIEDSNLLVKARTLRAVGELKQYDLLPKLHQQFTAKDPACRFWAVWSALLLKDDKAIDVLKPFFFNLKTPFFERALNIALRVMPITRSQRWLNTFTKVPDSQRFMIAGAGIVGDPENIPWLLKQMDVPEVSRVAGEALSMITGLDLAYDDLETDWPEGFQAGPTENPQDPEVAMDPDEDLPWPDVSLLKKWWDKNKNHYKSGVRYLCGQPIAVEHCQQVLSNGYQRQRRAAALELALLQPQQPLFNTSMPGFRQWQLLNVES